MGGVGSDAAIEASDIVIMDDKLTKILSAISISKKTKTIVIQNIVFALGVKIVILIFRIFRYLLIFVIIVLQFIYEYYK